MQKQRQISNVIYNLSNNFITIGGAKRASANGRKTTDGLNEWENILTTEVMNELLHLPADTVLIPFLKALGIPTDAADCDDILYSGILDIKNSYLNPKRVSHRDGCSVQADTTVVLSDCVVLFEFKNPRSAHSQNLHKVNDLGRQTLLAHKLMDQYGVRDYRIVLGSNAAPKIYIGGEGLLCPEDVLPRYFYEKPDPWLQKDFARDIAERVDVDAAKDQFIVKSWVDFFDAAISATERAAQQYDDKNIRSMLQNALCSLKWFRRRRAYMMARYRQ